MRTAIRFATGYHPADCFERYSSEKPEDIGGAAHGCIYYGKTQDGTIYVYTKNGFNNAPAIMKLDQVYNRNNKEYGEIMGIGEGSGFYLQK